MSDLHGVDPELEETMRGRGSSVVSYELSSARADASARTELASVTGRLTNSAGDRQEHDCTCTITYTTTLRGRASEADRSMMMDIQDMSRTARSTAPHLASAIVPTTRGITAMGTARALVANCSSQESFSIGQLRPVHASLSIGSLVVEKDIDDATDTCAAAP